MSKLTNFAKLGTLVFAGITGSGMSTSLKTTLESISQPLTTGTVAGDTQIVFRFGRFTPKQPSTPFYRKFGKSNRF
jgi:hypothetical protein